MKRSPPKLQDVVDTIVRLDLTSKDHQTALDIIKKTLLLVEKDK